MPPWTNQVMRAFSKVPANAPVHAYHVPYERLLYTIFPLTDHDDSTIAPMIYPPHPPAPRRRRSVGFELWWGEEDPATVFFLQLKTSGGLKRASAREAADCEMRYRLGELMKKCPLPTLHAVSAFGTRLRFYEYPKNGTILPTRQDGLDAARWGYDVTECAGGSKLKTVLEGVKENCMQKLSLAGELSVS
jgi:hypothetical protein